MKDLNDSLTLSMKTLSNDRSKRFDEHTKSNKFLEVTFNGAKSDAFEAKQQVSELKSLIAEQRITIKMQNKKINSLKAYSKYYNLKFFNIPEIPKKKIYILIQKIHHTLSMMEINPIRIYLDKIHRFPASGCCPGPVIVKFYSKMDHDLVWRKRILLGKSRSLVVIHEHLDETIEKIFANSY